MKRKKASKVRPKKTAQKETIVDECLPPFHEAFPITLILKEDKDKKICCFQCKDHLDLYIKKHKLKKNSFIIEKTKPREVDK